MNITMDDGREFALTQVGGRFPLNGSPFVVEVWQAEYVMVMRKLQGPFAVEVRGHGATPDEAIAKCYDELQDRGELDESHNPCPDCGKGRKIHSVATTYIPHDDKCPATENQFE